ncbi:hypothetical protein WT83_27260 [Burkholderia territorii]|uniref:Type-F conjugative transfer system pilin assembly protein TrbC n=2 Tax=Burkholderia territorii TaxID=1503055 RepID=A0A125BPN0_9BURK|nr:hypothetical protein WT27_13165 [Burkholderia territorii]KVX33819.1 hypothetical protein WT31_09065 [Burkholderia territorii]KWN06385.1 hypothetical protein WT83_27260 [Burkholderia territorii]
MDETMNSKRTTLLLATAGVVLLGASIAFAQTYTVPDAQDVKREQDRVRQQMSGVDAAKRPVTIDEGAVAAERKKDIGALLNEAADRASHPVVPPMAPDVRVLSGPAGAIDPASIAKQYYQVEKNLDEDSPKAMVMVSFSMPTESLKRIAIQAGKAHIPLVLRGIPGDISREGWQQLAAKLQPLKNLGADVYIHPVWFQRYKVDAVPTFVVAPNAKEGCDDGQCESGYVSIAGDVTLDFALERIRDKGGPAAKVAQDYLKTLGG